MTGSIVPFAEHEVADVTQRRIAGSTKAVFRVLANTEAAFAKPQNKKAKVSFGFFD